MSGWKGRLIAGLVVFVILFLLMTVFFGVVGLAGLILSYTWPILLILLIIWIFADSADYLDFRREEIGAKAGTSNFVDKHVKDIYT